MPSIITTESTKERKYNKNIQKKKKGKKGKKDYQQSYNIHKAKVDKTKERQIKGMLKF